jgi:hypothetical protein
MKNVIIIILIFFVLGCNNIVSVSTHQNELIGEWETHKPPHYATFKIIGSGLFSVTGVSYHESGHWFTNQDTLFLNYTAGDTIFMVYYIKDNTLFINHPPIEKFYKE